MVNCLICSLIMNNIGSGFSLVDIIPWLYNVHTCLVQWQDDQPGLHSFICPLNNLALDFLYV